MKGGLAGRGRKKLRTRRESLNYVYRSESEQKYGLYSLDLSYDIESKIEFVLLCQSASWWDKLLWPALQSDQSWESLIISCQTHLPFSW